MSNSINEAFGNVSLAVDNVKSNLAAAITAKGVQTNNTDMFSKMTENISKITAGGAGDKKYGVGDLIDDNDIEVHKPVIKKWQKKIDTGGSLCTFNEGVFVMDGKDLVEINTNTGKETKRKSGFSSISKIKTDYKHLYILTNNNLKKVSLTNFDILINKTYDSYYSNFLIDEDYIYLIGSDVRVTKVDKKTLKDEKSTGEMDYSFGADKSINDFLFTDKYIYISYNYNGSERIAKIIKSDFSHEIKRDLDSAIKCMVWDGKNIYSFDGNRITKRHEELYWLKKADRNFSSRISELLIKDNRLFLREDDTFICVDIFTFEVLYKIIIGTNKKVIFFPKYNDSKFFSVKYTSGNMILHYYESSTKYKYKVLR